MPNDELRGRVSSEVAKAIRQLREQRGLSMTQLAAQAGLSRQMISFVEHGLRNPTLDTLLRLAAVLKVDLADIIRDAEAAAAKKRRGLQS